MQNKTYAFCALLSRMKYISRWGLMRTTRAENLSEHAAETTVIAHVLALIATNILGQTNIRPETVATAAIYHDASEILTGDLPTPVKYKNNELRAAYKALERESAESLAQLVPSAFRGELGQYLTGDVLNSEEKQLLKAADRLSALIKCMEEKASGNTEFDSAKNQQDALLKQMSCPALDYFVAHFLPCYAQNLDELSKQE